MSKRVWLYVFGGAVLVHLLAFLAVAHLRVLPERRHIPTPEFRAAEATFTDPGTGDRIRVREFTVPTRLADLPQRGEQKHPQAPVVPIIPEAP